MKKIIIDIISLLIMLILVGCSAQEFVNNYNSLSVKMSGNKPPAFFTINNLQTMEKYVFETEDISFSLPSAKEEDFTLMGGWYGVSARNGKTISMSLKKQSYGVSVSTSRVSDYTQREIELESGNIKYLRNTIKIDKDDKLYIRNFGKEQYICEVMEYTRDKEANNKYITYDCYKFNTLKTKYKRVDIRLTYTKQNNQKVSNEYTYNNLKSRAKRMLDSLYIKNEWDN